MSGGEFYLITQFAAVPVTHISIGDKHWFSVVACEDLGVGLSSGQSEIVARERCTWKCVLRF